MQQYKDGKLIIINNNKEINIKKTIHPIIEIKNKQKIKFKRKNKFN